MSLTSTTTDRLFLGIDGGGSKCRAILVSSTNECLGAGVAGPANPFQDEEQAFHSVMEATGLALEDLLDACSAGAAGHSADSELADK